METMSDRTLESDLYRKVSEDIEVHFPQTDKTCNQDKEFCRISLDGVDKKIRLHDYYQIFSIPGLYEKIFYDHLRCCSPKTVCNFLKTEIKNHGVTPDRLRVLEIGAGNGMVGKQLKEFGVQKVVGVDILIEAKLAACRDYPHIYDDYFAIDLLDMPERIEGAILRKNLNTLVSVAALGFDDLPPLAYAKAFNLISENGWIAFNIKDRFLGQDDLSGFSKLVQCMVEEDILSINVQKKYQHRLALDDTPLYYYSIVGQKKANIPRSWFDEWDS